MKDLIIIGGGPAGLSAAVYAARYKLDTLILCKEVGGMAALAHKICNYPPFSEISGIDLTQRMMKQATDLNVEIKYEPVTEITNEGNFKIKTDKGEYEAKKVLVATGTKNRDLGVEGEQNYIGKGLSYCATCDGTFFKDKVVSVVGGGDAALTSALLLAEYASKVYIIYRRDNFFRAEPTWRELVEKNDKIEPVFNENVEEIKGEKFVEGVKLTSGKEMKLDGVFVEIGALPNNQAVESLDLDKEKGYIITDNEQRTNIKGVFAAGDITNEEFKQIVTATSQGAKAAYNVYKDIQKGI